MPRTQRETRGRSLIIQARVRCEKCKATGEVDCAAHLLVEALIALHSPECQRENGVLHFVRICRGYNCDRAAMAGKDICEACAGR